MTRSSTSRLSHGLHHCHSPHRGLLELYRVARQGVLVFEPRDTALVRLGVRLNLGQKYEVAAVSHNGLSAGGVGNSQIPNYIYRWSEREVEKTILSYAPYGQPRFRFLCAACAVEPLAVAEESAVSARRPGRTAGVEAFFHLVPKQANGFAFAVQKVLPRSPSVAQHRRRPGRGPRRMAAAALRVISYASARGPQLLPATRAVRTACSALKLSYCASTGTPWSNTPSTTSASGAAG